TVTDACHEVLPLRQRLRRGSEPGVVSDGTPSGTPFRRVRRSRPSAPGEQPVHSMVPGPGRRPQEGVPYPGLPRLTGRRPRCVAFRPIHVRTRCGRGPAAQTASETLRVEMTWSIRPYWRASSAVRILSRSMSALISDTSLLECLA